MVGEFVKLGRNQALENGQPVKDFGHKYPFFILRKTVELYLFSGNLSEALTSIASVQLHA